MSASSSKTLFSIKAEELKRVLRAAERFIDGRRSNRPSLRRAMIYFQDGKAWLAATDGHRAIRTQLPVCEGEVESFEEIFVDKKMMAHLRRRDVRGPVTVSVDDASIRFAWDGGEIVYPREGGYFPRVHALIDEYTSGVNEYDVDADELAQCVTAAAAQADNKKYVKVRIDNDSLTCSGWSKAGGDGSEHDISVERVYGCHLTGQHIYVDSKYLLSALKALKVLRRNSSVIFSYTEERAPLRLSDYGSSDGDPRVDIVIMSLDMRRA